MVVVVHCSSSRPSSSSSSNLLVYTIVADNISAEFLQFLNTQRVGLGLGESLS